MKHKKITALLLSAVLAVSAGCNGNPENTADEGVTTSVSEEVSAPQVQNNGWKFSQVAMGGGGFVSGVFATNEEGLYYARTDVGGAYRFNKDTQKWESVSYDISEEDRGLLGIAGLAFAENEPNKLWLLAGTSYFSSGMTCLLISNDYGTTFERVNLTEMIKVDGNGMGRGNGERIAVDPKNSDIVYIGGFTGGLIKSTDGGRNFTALDMGTKTETANKNGICSLVIDPKSGDENGCTTIFAAISRSGEPNLYKSTDGGATWNEVAGAPQDIMVQRMKYNGAGKLVITYADTEGPWNNDRKSGGVYTLDIASGEFTDISPAKAGFGDVVVDPENPDRMVACTENLYMIQPNGAYGDEFYRTTDGGANWTKLNDVMSLTDGGVEWLKTTSMHWCSSMCIDPNNVNKVMVVSGNGIFACDNIWDENPEFYFSAKGVEETVPYELVSIPGGKLATVTGDYDGFIQDTAEEYGMVMSSTAGSMTDLAVAGQAANVWVKCGGDSNTFGFWYSEDSGETWTNVRRTPLEGKKVAYKGSVAVSADGNTFYWAPENGNNIYYSTDKGQTWEQSQGGISAKHLAADPVNPDYIYAASSSSFYYSTDGGKTFKDNSSLSIFSAVRPIVEPGAEGKVYLPALGLQVSTDNGQTFTRIDSVGYCGAVGLGKGKTDDSPCTIFIWGKPKDCEETGIYWSEDEGKTWSMVSDPLHQFGGPGNGYFIYGDMNVYGRVYMSTVGLGVIYGDLIA